MSSLPTVYVGSVSGSQNLGNLSTPVGVSIAKISLSMTLSGDIGPETPNFPTIFNASTPGFQTTMNLLSGDNVIAVSTLAPLSGIFVFELPSGNTVVVREKVQPGDTGAIFVGWLAKGLCLAPGSPPAQIIINAASGITGCKMWLI